MAEAAEKATFLAGLVVTFKEQMHTDVLVKPGEDGPAIPTHKAVLVHSLSLTLLERCQESYTLVSKLRFHSLKTLYLNTCSRFW